MKKTLFLLTVAVVMVFTGCQKESPLDNESKIAVLSASIEQQSEPGATKTYLDGTTVRWSVGDSISVFYSDGNKYDFYLTLGDSTTEASFKSVGEPSGTAQYAIYPYNAGASISGSDITFNLPATQTYAKNSFAKGYNVAVAQVTGSGMIFKNVCGSLKLQLKGSMCVKTIELKGKNNEKLNGSFTVDASSATPSATAVSTSIDSEKSITLDCGDGVQLDLETATNFYFIVPAGAFASGFDAKIIDAAGDTYYKTVGTNLSNTITRSVVKAMRSKVVSLLPDMYTELYYLKSTGTQHINTGLSNCYDLKLKTSFLIENVDSEGVALGTHFIGGRDAEIVGGGFALRCYYSELQSEYFGDRQSISIQYGKQYSIIKNRNVTTFEGATYVSPVSTSEGVNPVLLFAQFATKEVRPFDHHIRIGTTLFWKNDILVRYFIPAKYSDGSLGMYNLVNGEFFTNNGIGTFIAGPQLTD